MEDDILLNEENQSIDALLLLIALAKASGKPLIIKKEFLENICEEDSIFIEYDKKKKTISIRYSFNKENSLLN